MIYELWNGDEVKYSIPNPLMPARMQRNHLLAWIRRYRPERIVRTD